MFHLPPEAEGAKAEEGCRATKMLTKMRKQDKTCKLDHSKRETKLYVVHVMLYRWQQATKVQAMRRCLPPNNLDNTDLKQMELTVQHMPS